MLSKAQVQGCKQTNLFMEMCQTPKGLYLGVHLSSCGDTRMCQNLGVPFLEKGVTIDISYRNILGNYEYHLKKHATL